MKIVVRKIGNSLGIIVPKERLQAWGVHEGEHLELTASGIRPQRRSPGSAQTRLDELKRRIALEVIARHSVAQIRERSLANLERWQSAGVWCSAYDEWRTLLTGRDNGALLSAMLEQDERANRLRQSMPFVGLLSEDVVERLREEATA